jgi:lipoyl(octanoyl) transferase
LVNEGDPSHIFLHDGAIEWAVASDLVDYGAAVAFMEARAAAIADGTARQLVWLLEHPALYTAGTSAKPHDLRDGARFPVFKSGRGGQYTYHGPGQRVAYLMLDLRPRGRDIRAFVQSVETWLIDALAAFNVKGAVRCGRVGVWVDRTQSGGPIREDKIAAIGLRVRKWVSFHGISFNVEPDLSHFDGIVPCGITEAGLGVTSLVDLGLPVTMDDADIALRASFEARFGLTTLVNSPI